MRRFAVLICMTSWLLPLGSYAQTPLLLDPAKAPMTLKGGWIHAKTGDISDIVLKIESIQPDGTVKGRLDFYNKFKHAACKAIDEPLKTGKVTADSLTVVADGGPPNVCGDLTLVFRRGSDKFLEGKTRSEKGAGFKMWLDAPK